MTAADRQEKKKRELFEPPELAANLSGVTRCRMHKLVRRGIRSAFPLIQNRERKTRIFRIPNSPVWAMAILINFFQVPTRKSPSIHFLLERIAVRSNHAERPICSN